MFKTLTLMILILVCCPQVHAEDICDGAVSAILKRFPHLATDEAFWTQAAEKKLFESPAELEKLARELSESKVLRAPIAPPEAALMKDAAITKRTLTDWPEAQFGFSNQVTVRYKKLEPLIKEKFNKFLELVSSPNGLNALRENGWSVEKLRSGGYSARLSRGDRVVFDFDRHRINILDIGTDVYKH